MPQAIEFWPLKLLSEVLGVHWDSISQSGSCLGSVKVHSPTLSYTPGSLWSDSCVSSCPATFQPLCLGRELKIRVVTKEDNYYNNRCDSNKGKLLFENESTCDQWVLVCVQGHEFCGLICGCRRCGREKK